MNTSKYIFNRRLLFNYIDSFKFPSNFRELKKTIEPWIYTLDVSSKMKETANQGNFFTDIFTNILGYEDQIGKINWNISISEKCITDMTKADAALGYFNVNEKDVRVAVELKDSSIDLDKKIRRVDGQPRSAVEQAFSYAPKYGKQCQWVIVSNFRELRLYNSLSQNEYECFNLPDLVDDKVLKKFYFLFSRDNLISKNGISIVDNLYKVNEEQQESITSSFYEEFRRVRTNLFKSFAQYNAERNSSILLEKSQKVLDRIIFIRFAEDTGLLPRNSLQRVFETAKSSYEASKYKIWPQLKGLFGYIDKGNPPYINHFNGGLFAEDEYLDSLLVPDEILEQLEFFSKYDFNTDLNVNILGHIFEQSLSDLETHKEVLQKLHRKSNRRKKEGIYYTPESVTRFISEECIGNWLSDQRKQLGEENIKPINKCRNSSDRGKLKKFLLDYRNVLSDIRILDPTCGSGAFLSQCFDYLIQEHYDLSQRLEELGIASPTQQKIETNILKNNLFGVDLNPAAVNLTKLSLWLKTANREDCLLSLDSNIKCGNSLIDNPHYASDKAFCWDREFAEILINGGFDIITANPPYGGEFNKNEKEYLAATYITHEYNFDSYTLFIELFGKLLRPNGYVGMITPNTFFVKENGVRLRKYLFNKYRLFKIAEAFDVFPDAIVEPIITIMKLEKPYINDHFQVILGTRGIKPYNVLTLGSELEFSHSDLYRRDNMIFHYREKPTEWDLFRKITSKGKRLDYYAYVTTGVKPYQKGKGKPKQTDLIVETKPFTGFIQYDEHWLPLVRGMNINRYSLTWDNEYIKYGEWLAEPREQNVFIEPKLLIRRTDDRLLAVYDDTGVVCLNSAHCIQAKNEEALDLHYLLSLLNSKLINWYFRHENFHMVDKPFAEVKVVYLERLPIIYTRDMKALIQLSLQASELYQNLNEIQNKFNNFLQKVYKTSHNLKRLNQFWNLTFSEFSEELTKEKVVLDINEKYKLLPLFEDEKRIAAQTQARLHYIEQDIDERVYSLYGATTSEIRLIETCENPTVTTSHRIH